MMTLVVLMCQVGFVGEFDINSDRCKTVSEQIAHEDVDEKKCIKGAFFHLPQIAASHPKYEIKKFFCTNSPAAVQREKT